jgi:putative restriction endonuclease
MQGWIIYAAADETDQSVRRALTSYNFETDDRVKKRIAVGDLLFIVDDSRLFGIAQVDGVTEETKKKTGAVCPVCSTGKIEIRKRRKLPHRCFYGHQFAVPAEAILSALMQMVHFTHGYINVSAQIEPAELRPFEYTNGRHLKVKQCDIEGVCRYIAKREHSLYRILKSWLATRIVVLSDNEGDSSVLPPFPTLDERDLPLQAIRLRRGATSFRNKLINRYGPRCMISECAIVALLEAAHISKYHGPADNHPANGLLLRSDLHTLFDLDMIGINPVNLEVTVHDNLAGSEYQKLSGKRLRFSRDKAPDARAIRARWKAFSQKMERDLETSTALTQALD